jgi:hypothetical protein
MKAPQYFRPIPPASGCRYFGFVRRLDPIAGSSARISVGGAAVIAAGYAVLLTIFTLAA